MRRAGFLLLVLFGLGVERSEAAATALPNIVLIYTDDQGYGDVSALNPEARFKTPNIDRLVTEGLTFTDGHCTDTVCSPSRYGLLTGRYSWRTRLKSGVLGAEGKCLIENGRMTLASLLRDAGYQTAMIGKWHLGMVFDGEVGRRDWTLPFRDGPTEKGFDYFFGIPASMNYGVLTYLENDRVLRPASLWTAKKPGKVTYDKASYRITPPYEAERPEAKQPLEVAGDFNDERVLETFTRKAIQWIAGAVTNRRPFFVYLPLTSPHKPVCPQPRFEGRSECGAYGDFMVETDHWVGEVMRALKRLGIDDNTMIVFTSDNGPENTYKERIDVYGHRSAGIYRGGKRDRYEGGHRVPFLIRWPAGVRAGTKCDAPVCQSDLLATFAEMVDAKLPADAGEDSQSFWAAMIGKGVRGAGRVPLVHHSASGHFAIRDGDWKLLLNESGSGRGKGRKRGTKVLELYNLRQDPSETEEVSAEHPDIVKRLTDRLTAIVQNGRSTPGPRQANDRRWWRQLTWLPEP